MGQLLLVHVTFDLPAVHKDTEPVVPNQTGSAVKTKQPCIRASEPESNWGWLEVRRWRWAEAGGTSNCCLNSAAGSTLTPQPPPLVPVTAPPLSPRLLFWICPLISIPDLSSRHLQPVYGAKQRPDIMRAVSLYLSFTSPSASLSRLSCVFSCPPCFLSVVSLIQSSVSSSASQRFGSLRVNSHQDLFRCFNLLSVDVSLHTLGIIEQCLHVALKWEKKRKLIIKFSFILK